MHVEAVLNLGEPEIFIFTEAENPDQNEKLIFAGMNEMKTGSDGDLQCTVARIQFFAPHFFRLYQKEL